MSEPRDGHRYWVRLGDGPEREVTKAEFIAAERAAGFYSKFGPNEVATAAFSNGRISGRTEVVDDKRAFEDTLRILKREGLDA